MNYIDDWIFLMIERMMAFHMQPQVPSFLVWVYGIFLLQDIIYVCKSLVVFYFMTILFMSCKKWTLLNLNNLLAPRISGWNIEFVIFKLNI